MDYFPYIRAENAPDLALSFVLSVVAIALLVGPALELGRWLWRKRAP